jgi:hypothetical protein
MAKSLTVTQLVKKFPVFCLFSFHLHVCFVSINLVVVNKGSALYAQNLTGESSLLFK